MTDEKKDERKLECQTALRQREEKCEHLSQICVEAVPYCSLKDKNIDESLCVYCKDKLGKQPVKPGQEKCERCDGDKRGANSPIGFIFPCPECNSIGLEPSEKVEGVEEMKSRILAQIIAQIFLEGNSKQDKSKAVDNIVEITDSFYHKKYLERLVKIMKEICLNCTTIGCQCDIKEFRNKVIRVIEG